MANHPNRGKKYTHPARKPDPATIAAHRRAAGLTQRESADLIYATTTSWEAWERGERPMHSGLWELFKLKTFDDSVLKALGLERSSRSRGLLAATTTTPTSVGTSAPVAKGTSSRPTR